MSQNKDYHINYIIMKLESGRRYLGRVDETLGNVAPYVVYCDSGGKVSCSNRGVPPNRFCRMRGSRVIKKDDKKNLSVKMYEGLEFVAR